MCKQTQQFSKIQKASKRHFYQWSISIGKVISKVQVGIHGRFFWQHKTEKSSTPKKKCYYQRKNYDLGEVKKKKTLLVNTKQEFFFLLTLPVTMSSYMIWLRVSSPRMAPHTCDALMQDLPTEEMRISSKHVINIIYSHIGIINGTPIWHTLHSCAVEEISCVLA